MIGYVVLLGLIGYLALRAYIGYKKGFVKTVLSIANLLIAIVVAAMVVTPVASFLKANTQMHEKIHFNVSEYVDENAVIDEKTVNNLELPKAIKDMLIKEADTEVTSYTTQVVDKLSDLIHRALTFLILVVVLYITIKILINVLDLVTKLPVLNQINKVSGLIIGILNGLVTIWIAAIVLTIFSNTESAQEVFKIINGNEALSFIYNNNVLVVLFTKWLV